MSNKQWLTKGLLAIAGAPGGAGKEEEAALFRGDGVATTWIDENHLLILLQKIIFMIYNYIERFTYISAV